MNNLTKVNKMKKETINITINKKKVKILHKSERLFDEQKEGLKQLKQFLYDEIVFQQKNNGFIPYNNFESSVEWEVA
tara:strand:- start:1318 stop:1548 length:231 start_codon:yes stop_codon:yes gene_type:complete